MQNLWTPQDNKFATELQVELEQIKFSIRRLEADLKITISSIETAEIKTEMLLENLDVLKSGNVKIVSINEYKSISDSLATTLKQEAYNKHKKEEIKKIIDAELKKIPLLEAEIEKVRFKLLEFKNEKQKK